MSPLPIGPIQGHGQAADWRIQGGSAIELRRRHRYISYRDFRPRTANLGNASA